MGWIHGRPPSSTWQGPEQSAGGVSDRETGSTASALLGGLKGRQAELVTGHRDGWECTGLSPPSP